MKKILQLMVLISMFIAQSTQAFNIYVYNKTGRPITISYKAEALLKTYDNKIEIQPGGEQQILDLFATCHLKSLDFPLYHLGRSAGNFNLFEVFKNFNEVCTRVTLDWIGFTIWDDLKGDDNAYQVIYGKNEWGVPWVDIHVNANGLYGLKMEQELIKAGKKIEKTIKQVQSDFWAFFGKK